MPRSFLANLAVIDAQQNLKAESPGRSATVRRPLDAVGRPLAEPHCSAAPAARTEPLDAGVTASGDDF